MDPKDADGMANSVDPEQTGSTLLAQTCLSKHLGSLRVHLSFKGRLVYSSFHFWFILIEIPVYKTVKTLTRRRIL